MDATEEWERICARAQGLATTLEILGQRNVFSSLLERSYLGPALVKLADEIRRYADAYGATLTDSAKAALQDGLRELPDAINNPQEGYISSRIALLSTLATEVSYHLRDIDSRAAGVVERAFLHLQRSLVADPDIRAKWQQAFNSTGETACEQLGATHLLLHGIYSFKTDTAGERSDLVLGGKLSIDTAMRRAAIALVQTEWKLTRQGDDTAKKAAEALHQAKRYSAGHLAGFELQRFRYLVLVSEDRRALPDDIIEGPIVYRHINVAINQSVPSKSARA